MATKQNASTIKTRRRLHDACLRLAEDQDMRSLTVNQIVREAGLNRTTFYLHYPDASSLIEACVDELFERLGEGGRQLLDWDSSSLVEWEETFFSTIAKHPRLFARMLSGPHDDAFVRKLLESAKTGIREMWKQNGYLEGADEAYVSMRLNYAASGGLGMTVGWLEAGMPVSAGQICRWAWELAVTVGRMPIPPETTMSPAEAKPAEVSV